MHIATENINVKIFGDQSACITAVDLFNSIFRQKAQFHKKIVLSCKNSKYIYETNTMVFTIPSTIKWAKFLLSLAPLKAELVF